MTGERPMILGVILMFLGGSLVGLSPWFLIPFLIGVGLLARGVICEIKRRRVL